MARAGLTRVDIKRARDSLIAQGMHASIDAIRIALGNTGSKTTIHRYLKELDEEESASLTRAASLSDAIQDLVARLAARLHEEAQVRIDQQAAAAAAQHQQAQTEIAKLTGELAALQAQLANASAALSSEQDAHADTRLAVQQCAIDIERLSQQVHDQTVRLAEHESFRQSLEEKLKHAHDALEHYRTASREQREQEARRHETQVQQLQAELRQTNQTAIVKQNEITQLNKDNARLVAESGAASKSLREARAHGEQIREALDRMLADHVRLETERDALRATVSAQSGELESARASLSVATAERTKLAAQVDAQLFLLADYRASLGLGGTVG
ncbi:MULTISPECIES: DNA-binding protein [unclassified Burkholderia]|uniref:DNA-binding protein n=1 Tax=unclassified Burkholderia TaxID=2613784 RepID=UPI0007564C90|nr:MULTISPECIES: DNA-binding protein [unclassified Burkholderia]KUY56326.1 integrase [Burkholderia sp. RF2-non_BP3]KUY70961.1 integrase [Burkholderia sp. RF4-BP95]KUZ03849.1 integrase [Burkholderia sp. RF7-non_BP1]KUZ05052.1 integrase [Burkholderia sp. RF7-non_BP4]